MKYLSKIWIICDKSKLVRRLIFCDLNGVGAVFLNGNLTAAAIFFSHCNRTWRNSFNFQLPATPFRMPGEIRYIIKYALHWSVDENLMNAYNGSHVSLSFHRDNTNSIFRKNRNQGRDNSSNSIFMIEIAR